MSVPPWPPPRKRRSTDTPGLPPPPGRRRKPDRLSTAQDVLALLIGSAAAVYEVFLHADPLRPEVLLFAAGVLGVPFLRRLDRDPPP